jgi:hypothetical protein
MKPMLTPVEFSRLLDDYTFKSISQHTEMYAIKQRVLEAYVTLYNQLPKLHTQSRPHAHLIKAWADGATIECWYPTEEIWVERENPNWLPEFDYRIKGDDHGA